MSLFSESLNFTISHSEVLLLPVCLITRSCLRADRASREAFRNVVRVMRLLFYRLPHEAWCHTHSLYLSLDTGTPIKNGAALSSLPAARHGYIRAAQSGVTVIQFPLPARALCFNSTP